MKQKKEPRRSGTIERGKHKLNAGYFTKFPCGFQLDFRLVEPLAWLAAALLLGGHHA
ncbi:MAG: hypothetical protein GX087_12055 [Desulfobulbaceae bacterium]|jgi:hypothetical protein|nr:hypothetical protein [Desulfobulbaceae bacterium]